ncbi:MAG: CinA family protein [Paracoccaceae bacterium]
MSTYKLAAEILDKCKARGWRIATAESCTGGLLAAALTDVPGSSAIFERGYVSYSYPSKSDMLGVSAQMLHAHGAVSEPVAAEMAEGALANARVDLAIAVTGVAGPGADGDKPEGLVWFAVATKSGVVTHESQFGAIGRGNVRASSVTTGLNMLRDALT